MAQLMSALFLPVLVAMAHTVIAESTTTTTTTTTETTTTTVPCVNLRHRCNYWAHIGECQKNPKWMREYCNKACAELFNEFSC